MRTSHLRFLLICTVVATTATARAGAVQLGMQNYSDGQLINGVAAWEAGSAGDVEPFKTFKGNDFTTNFSVSWTFNFAAGTVAAASTTIGIWDHDSAAPGDQVASFTVNGFDLSALLNGAFNSKGGAQAENDIYTIALPNAALGLLSAGVANFQLTLQGLGLQGVPGTCCNTTPDNGAGLDFVSLTTSAVPEPTSLILLGSSLVAFAFMRRRHGSSQE
jgi:PEP-CTERM motif